MYNTLWLLICSSLFIAGVFSEKKVVCYYGSWSTYRNGNGKCEVKNLNPFICTHLIYGFVGINEDATVRIMDPWLELPDNWGKDNFGQFNLLKKTNPKLKTIIACGGWNEGSAKFSKVANDPTLRVKFAQNAAEFTVKYGFDGFDMDWEYPAQRDSTSKNTDKQAFTLLLKEMRKQFDLKGLTLSAAVASVKSSASLSYDIPEVSKYLDFINVMTYDMHGAWDKVTGHNAALHRYAAENLPAADSFNVEIAIDYWLSQGAPAEKIILGIPLYGRTFRLANPAQNSVGSPSTGPGIAGQYTSENGMIGLNELCEKRLTQSWPERWDDQAQVPFTSNNNDWISYDNERSIKAKVQFALSRSLGGAMVWSIETDDFRNVCGKGSYPHLTLINSELGKNIVVTTTTPSGISTTTTSTTTRTATSTPQISTTTAKTTTTTKSPSSNTCTSEGYFRDSTDCSKFYHCVKINNSFVQYWYTCPPPLRFDTKLNVCNFPENVPC